MALTATQGRYKNNKYAFKKGSFLIITKLKIFFVLRRTYQILSKYREKYEYQEQTAEVEIIGADGSIFVSNFREKYQ